ncbi:hypothetical protein PanWU01x14_191530 [Parasponia andersonii]|uniref:Uncharacterized protein n=1 Tax=Parasponia andersonii TaxID=3476 RepID=A0A2P5C1I5_PARAD|nr:hypothetical protein PanWU01x14_191530 [Parasponia andersonii]
MCITPFFISRQSLNLENSSKDHTQLFARANAALIHAQVAQITRPPLHRCSNKSNNAVHPAQATVHLRPILT